MDLGERGVEDIVDLGGGNGRGQDPAMEAGGESTGGTATIYEDTTSTEARKAAPIIFWGEAHGEIG